MKYLVAALAAMLVPLLPMWGETAATAPAPVAAIPTQTTPNREPLSGSIESNVEMTAEPQEVMLGKLTGVVIEVRNGTDRPLIFDGDHATATTGSSQLQAAPLSAIDEVAHPVKLSGQRFKRALKDTIVAGVTIGAYPAAHDMQIQAGPILKRYGWDEVRRQDEITRFGKRILWPGDSSQGVLYFAGHNSLHGATVELPVTSVYDITSHALVKCSH